MFLLAAALVMSGHASRLEMDKPEGDRSLDCACSVLSSRGLGARQPRHGSASALLDYGGESSRREGESAAGSHPSPGPVAESLRKGKYPWYDAEADRLQPVWARRISWLEGLRSRLRSISGAIDRWFRALKFGGNGSISVSGNAIATVLLLAVLVAFIAGLFALWLRRGSGPTGTESRRPSLGTAILLGDLPEGLRPSDADPWAEAKRRRAAGDFAGAIVCLFAHQLLALDERGLIRLAPGKTGRHYLVGLRDRELAASLRATLGVFEDVYYGRRLPDREVFESVWALAQVFQERVRILRSGALP